MRKPLTLPWEAPCACGSGKTVRTEYKTATISWLAQPGERVRAGQPLLTAEVEKSTIEVESPWDGVLAAVLVGQGATCTAKTILAYIDAD